MKAKVAAGLYIRPTRAPLSIYPYTKLYGRVNCNFCHKPFWKTGPRQTCCSISCRHNICSQNKCRKTHVPYFNKLANVFVDLQSSWEVSTVKLLDALSIAWSRPSSRVIWHDDLSTAHTYLPDFYLPQYNLYLDVKNPFKIAQDQNKLSKIKLIIPLYVGTLAEMKTFLFKL